VGDDGDVALTAAASYDIRVGSAPIQSEEDFGDATPLDTTSLTPAVQGATETFVVGGLTPDATYYFAMKVDDEVGNRSGLSNSAGAATMDLVPPVAISNLDSSLAQPLYERMPVVGVSASSQVAPFLKENIVDGNPATFWSTPGRRSMRVEWITLDLGSVQNIGRVVLTSRMNNAAAFPRAFNIQVSTEGETNFTTVHWGFVYTASPGTPYIFDFDPVPARYVKLLVSRANLYGNLYAVHLAEVQAYRTTHSGIDLNWTAPGDNGSAGTAFEYDIRISTSAITDEDEFNDATPVEGAPNPRPSGTPQSFTLVDLTPLVTYNVAMKSRDEVGNESPLSNVVSFSLPCTENCIADTETRLVWDPSRSDTVTEYRVYISQTPGQYGFPIGSVPAEGPMEWALGSGGFAIGTRYYAVVTAVDEEGNQSLASNQVDFTFVSPQ
jgi:hypothetical protein